MEQDFGSKPWSQTSWETLGARFRWKSLESDFGGSAWSQTLMGNTWRKILGETRKPLEQDFREDTHGARPRGEHSWSKTSGETLGAKLRGKCWEQNYGGNPWSKTSAETLEATFLSTFLSTLSTFIHLLIHLIHLLIHLSPPYPPSYPPSYPPFTRNLYPPYPLSYPPFTDPPALPSVPSFLLWSSASVLCGADKLTFPYPP